MTSDADDQTRRFALSKDQLAALEQVSQWIHEPTQLRKTLGGYAGTGKTTLIRTVVRNFGHLRPAVCAYTGKAAAVLLSKGVQASTIHRLIYATKIYCGLCGDPERPSTVTEAGVCKACDSDDYLERDYRLRESLPHDLIIVDEASMLSTPLLSDLESFGKPLLLVGDHGQLEPVGDDPKIMREPEIRLERIHRQAESSPIIGFAHFLREGGNPEEWKGSGVQVRRGAPPKVELLDYDVILCGYNRLRISVNSTMRKMLGHHGDPQPGERLICLRNDNEQGLYNGLLVTITSCTRRRGELLASFVDDVGNNWTNVRLDEDRLAERPARKFGRRGVAHMTFGYALTVHKAQGSEWPRVLVFEDIAPTWEAARWRYTAATRAAHGLSYCLRR